MRPAGLIAAVLILIASGGAQASNAGGMLYVHTTHVEYSVDDGSYAGEAQISCNENHGDCGDQEDCSSEAWALNPTGVYELCGVPRIFYVLAVFPWNSCPRVTGVTFGIDYDEHNIFIADYGLSGHFELADVAWPAPQAGTAVTWSYAQKAQMVEIYWFAAYAYYDPGTLALTPHPTQGGQIADDSVPVGTVTIPGEGYGVAGLGGAAGFNPYGDVRPVIEESWGSIKNLFSDHE